MHEALRYYDNFRDCERQISEWLSTAETLVNDKNLENQPSLEYHEKFFNKIKERWIEDLVDAGQNLKKILPTEKQYPVINSVNSLQSRWNDVLSSIPLHMMKLEFRSHEPMFYQSLKEIEKEISLEQQAILKNDDIDGVLNRNNDFFLNKGKIDQIEQQLDNLKKMSKSYSQLKPNDRILNDAVHNAERCWNETLNKIESLKAELHQLPQQWSDYRKM